MQHLLTPVKGFLGILLVIAALASCQSAGVVEQKPFSSFNYFDFSAEVERLASLNPHVEKTVEYKGTTETIVDTLNWKQELALFVASDINNPRNKNRYSVEVTEVAGGRVVTYTADSPELQVQVVKQTFEGDKCREVYIKRGANSTFQEVWQELVYQPGASYAISGRQNVKLAFDEDFRVIGKIVGGEPTIWRATLDLGAEKLPFTFRLIHTNAATTVQLINGAEVIEAQEVEMRNDSLFVQLPVFMSEIKAAFDGPGTLHGQWYNRAKGPDYMLPFAATATTQPRFASKGEAKQFGGKWEVDFSPEGDHYKAIGLFKQQGNRVTGTFMTETGDYRYLEGAVSGDSLLLSTFDGAHAFLFKAALVGNKLKGAFWSGNHWQEPWQAQRNETFELTNPDSLTWLVEGAAPFGFEVIDQKGATVSLTDEQFAGKVTIVQIIGSWCPNCMDETAYLAELHKKYHAKGLEVVALCYERGEETAAYAAIHRMQQHFGAEYPFLLAGDASKQVASETFPMLNGISSFPTTVYIDRSGTVRKIHTGFYGPGTGEYYTRFVEQTDALVRELLMEGLES